MASPSCVLCLVGILTLFTSVVQGNLRKTPAVDPSLIRKVHLIFMNHLDVGYDGIYPTVGFALNVINKYFTEYYPRAVSLAEGLRLFGFQERLVYTTHPWLLRLYLNCTTVTMASNVSLQCPSQDEVNAMRLAINNGDVVWHAGPMNMQYEFFMDPTLLDMALDISFGLDREFNIQRTTPVVSQRDVPGMTSAVIPIMKKHNITAITVGVNQMTSPPALPSQAFVWKMRPEDKDEDGVIAFWHPGGYPGNPGSFPIMAGGMSVKDCVFAQDVQAFPETLCFAFRTDNSGPPETIQEILGNFELARGQFPNAMVQGSTLDDFVSALKASPTTFEPVTQEIGDTWIMGVQSDPKKTAMYRAFVRAFADCITIGLCESDDPRITQAAFYLTKIPEHTWGLNGVGDLVNWSNAAFEKARSGQGYINCTASWQEQRQFLDLALNSLGSHPVVPSIMSEFENLEPSIPDLTGYDSVSLSDEYTCTDGTVLAFATDGSLGRLYDPYNKVEWATDSSRMGQILYSTYNETDYDHMSKLYDYIGGGAGFHKVNSTSNAHPVSRQWEVIAKNLYKKTDDPACDFIVKILPVDYEAVTDYGLPAVFYVHYAYVPNQQKSLFKGELQMEVQWFNKGPTRLSEAISVGFSPLTRTGSQWTMSKLGELIDPTNVILNGSQYLHAINKGVYYLDGNQTGLEVLSPDVALLTLSTASHPPSVFPVPLSAPSEPFTSAAFNIYNNLWTTNYIFWYPFLPEDLNFKVHFYLHFM
ncbi:uncharacterized protein LOC112576153 [Pomacea canaliculata]|uniref:uncharacterized protein LOC112576153 n=1 Tax=Pomacea canaliculata TaxID=400727 RepID=UPI000D738128|nr:uncharacterized protein LOC112576153 [Pomacea canaliculata]